MINFNKQIMDLAISKIPNYSEIVILCSSGVDSVSASHIFNKKYSKKYKRSVLLHFNHEQREQNVEMQRSYYRFVESQKPNILGYPSWPLGSSIKTKTEDGMRKARIDHIKEFYENTIFITGHHLSDCVTGYLLNVLRGKEGYLPIPFVTQVGTNVICHPFLFTKKQDFIDYAEKNDLMKYVVHDSTNDEIRGSRRNFIRKDILPLLEREKMGLETIVKKKLNERLMLEIIKS